MKMLIHLLLVTILLPSIAWADDEDAPIVPPKAVISGPVEGLPGDFIDLDASGSVGDFFEWIVEPSLFKDGRKTFRFPKGPDGKQPEPQKSKECGIASRPGEYHITLIVSNKGGIAKAQWLVVVFASPPQTTPNNPPPQNPPSNPPANPPPQNPPSNPPANPSPIPNLSDWVFQQASSLVPNDGRRETANILANGYRKNVEKIGPLIKDPVAFAKAQNITNQGVMLVTGATAKWDKFFKALAEKLGGVAVTREQQDKMWAEIADGLERVN